ncbi:MAG: hypothetical protein LBJ67_15305 [Planctomycetaceae bacterium]|jgi:hypothetical protein|nr:hypothetical protein [Planctomycetaceae bacterium]
MDTPNSSSEAARLALSVIALTAAGQPINHAVIKKLYELSGLQELENEKKDEPTIFSLAKYREKQYPKENIKNRKVLTAKTLANSPHLKIFLPEENTDDRRETVLASTKTVPLLKIFEE